MFEINISKFVKLINFKRSDTISQLRRYTKLLDYTAISK